jgi:hypothetical protein
MRQGRRFCGDVGVFKRVAFPLRNQVWLRVASRTFARWGVPASEKRGMNTARRQLAGRQAGEITSFSADVGCPLALMQRGL